METFLNLAHRSSRKAEYYNKCQQFSEAIFHYTKASEYLDKAILSTKCDNIRASLIVQRNYCADQIEFLKRRLYDKIKKESSRLNDQAKPVEQVTAKLPLTTMSSEMFEQKYKDLNSAMKEHDSLLHCLTDVPPKSPQASQASAGPSNQSSPKNESKSKSDIKRKEGTEIFEELKMTSEKMRQCIFQLVDNLETSQQEVHRLKDENSQLLKELSVLKAVKASSSSEKPMPDMPPLEPPRLLY